VSLLLVLESADDNVPVGDDDPVLDDEDESYSSGEGVGSSTLRFSLNVAVGTAFACLLLLLGFSVLWSLLVLFCLDERRRRRRRLPVLLLVGSDVLLVCALLPFAGYGCDSAELARCAADDDDDDGCRRESSTLFFLWMLLPDPGD